MKREASEIAGWLILDTKMSFTGDQWMVTLGDNTFGSACSRGFIGA